jgi:pimeloyl-ACP methyl ester carboxylesterase
MRLKIEPVKKGSLNVASLKNSASLAAKTQVVQSGREQYAYRRFGKRSGLPLVLLQHFTGTLDNWDPALTDELAEHRDIILFDNAGIGGSSGTVPDTMAAMADHVTAFLDAMEIPRVDILGFSLGGCLAQIVALNQPGAVRRMLLIGTAPEGGEDIMHLNKPEIAGVLNDRSLKGYEPLAKIFFAPSTTSLSAGQEFVARVTARTTDPDRPSGPEVAAQQMKAFQAWEAQRDDRFGKLKNIKQPCLVIHGALDTMIGSMNGYWLARCLPNAVLLMYPDSAHGVLFQYHAAVAAATCRFLDDQSDRAML